MSQTSKKIISLILMLAATAAVSFHVTSANDTTGPSSSASPYVIPAAPGVFTKSILTVGDSVNTKPDGVTPYRLVGIPDGLGAFDNDDSDDDDRGNGRGRGGRDNDDDDDTNNKNKGTFTLLMNHELRAGVGAVRAHGANGAFVSKWIIRKKDLSVVRGDDLIQQVATWNTGTKAFNLPAKGVVLSRLCSADLPLKSAFYNEEAALGYHGRLLMNGEESGAEGRAFAHALDGTSYELPRLGKFSWENSVANPQTGNKTVVVGTDDGGGGQVYIYVDDKTGAGSPVEQAGLTNGNLYGLKVQGVTAENPASGIASGTTFTLHNFGNVENKSGAELETLSTQNAVTTFQRPEDGAWDPRYPNDFYFVTTASFTTNSRLWRLRFNDRRNPAAGGRIDMLLDGTEGHKMLDNLTVTRRGQIVLQEDPGAQDHIAKIWRYSIKDDTLNLIAQHDPARFTPGAPNFLTRDEESSGVIDMSDILGEGWFLLDVQAHYFTDPELVEGGQLLALRYPPGKK